MREYVREITGAAYLPKFSHPVLFQSELVSALHDLHRIILEEQTDFCKEEMLFLLLDQLLKDYADTASSEPEQHVTSEIQQLCEYMECHYTENISLNELSELSGMSKYHFAATVHSSKRHITLPLS